MSAEANSWVELTLPQGAFFAAQLAAAGEVVFGPAAHEATIAPLNAAQYSVKVSGDETLRTIMWPDAFEPSTVCIASIDSANLSDAHRRHVTYPAKPGKAAFIRVSQTPEAFTVEGVGTNLTATGNDSLYGRMELPRNQFQPAFDTNQHVGVGFVRAAIASAATVASRRATSGRAVSYSTLKPNSDLIVPATPTSIEIPNLAHGIVGIDGVTTGRLFRSLSSLTSNLAIGGIVNERMAYSTRTYDIANILLNSAIESVVSNKKAETGDRTILLLDGNRAAGAVFETADGEMTLVRRGCVDKVDAITVATASRPRIDDDIIHLQQYVVQARGVTSMYMPLPSESYEMNMIAATSLRLAESPQAVVLRDIGEDTRKVLEQKMLGIITEKVGTIR